MRLAIIGIDLGKHSCSLVVGATGGMPGNADDQQARYIEAAVSVILVASIYLPNGNPRPGPKFDYKLAWFERLIAHADALLVESVPVVLAGDYNVVPTDLDIYPSTSWGKNALLQPESRAAFTRLLKQGWVDAIRTRHSDERLYSFWDYLYSFWDYKRGRWGRDAGLRLDHLLLSPAVAGRLATAGVDRDVRGREGASDHAPTWVTLTEPKAKVIKPPPRREKAERSSAT